MMLLAVLTGCGNYELFDTTYTFDRATIELQDGTVVTGKVVSWLDYENSDQIQITMEDGNTYLVHSSKCTLIAEK